ncbi:hypothetical protein Q3G72_004861 [Acer saccharum]|nr:hypothetical protein Q3G72_004861 [Acer saccharum]
MRAVALERLGTKFNRPNEKGLPNQGRILSDPFEEVEIDPSRILKQSKLKVPLGRKEVVSESIDVILPRGSGHISLVKSSDQVGPSVVVVGNQKLSTVIINESTGGMPKKVSGELGLDQNVGQKMKGVDGVEVGIDISLRSPHTQGMASLSYGFIDNKCGKRKLVVSHKKLIDAKQKKWDDLLPAIDNRSSVDYSQCPDANSRFLEIMSADSIRHLSFSIGGFSSSSLESGR